MLSNPALWTTITFYNSTAESPPPSSWNGSGYDIFSEALALSADATAGGTIEGTVSVGATDGASVDLFIGLSPKAPDTPFWGGPDFTELGRYAGNGPHAVNTVVPPSPGMYVVIGVVLNWETEVTVFNEYGQLGPIVLSAPAGILTANPDSATTLAATAVNVPVLANDTLDGSPVALGDLTGPPTIVTPPTQGTAVVQPDGTVTYTPPAGFCGQVTFQYTIFVDDDECPELFINNGCVDPESLMSVLPDGTPLPERVSFWGPDSTEYTLTDYEGGGDFCAGRNDDPSLPCEPDFPYPWDVEIRWDEGPGVCVTLTNGCS